MEINMQSCEDLRNDMLARYWELLTSPYPTFSEAEMLGREKSLKDLLSRLDLNALMIAEAARAGTATGWTTGWPVTAEAVTVILPDAPRTMFIQYLDHLLDRAPATRTTCRIGGIF